MKLTVCKFCSFMHGRAGGYCSRDCERGVTEIQCRNCDALAKWRDCTGREYCDAHSQVGNRTPLDRTDADGTIVR